MDCVTHPGMQATAFCQNCGRGICTECIASTAISIAARGMILCPSCVDVLQRTQPAWTQPTPGMPNPATAAVLGLIPGVGAMYNAQFFKGLIHVVVFAVLVSISEHYPIFGLFIAAWIFYQSFEAFHTAKARRDGEPLPDPLGINELGNWMHLGNQPPASGRPVQPGPQTQQPWTAPGQAQQPPEQQAAPQQAWDPPYGQSWDTSWQQNSWPPPPPPGTAIPPVPPPAHWRRSEPIGALVLIGLGILFLMGQLNIFSFHIFHYTWPLMLIALGVWLIIRRAGDAQGGPK